MSGDFLSDQALVERVLALDERGRRRLLNALTPAQAREFGERWGIWAHPGQYEPEGEWRVWLIRAGRGFGKTRAGAEWVSQFARDHPAARIALVGHTMPDVAKVMVEGTSGLIAVAHPGEQVGWSRMRGEVRFASGATAQVYAATAPESLRGPEHHGAWCDELAKWSKGFRLGGSHGGEAAWDNLMLGLRSGDRPRVVVTTTPRPNALMRRVMQMDGVRDIRGATRDNVHLPTSFVAEMDAQYGDTRLGRQELEGEMIDDAVGALWTRATIEACRSDVACEPVRVVVGVDPPAGIGGDACGIVAVALDGDGIAHVLEDASVSGASPEAWARAVAACADRHGADRVIAEANQGGEMVRRVLHIADVALPVRMVHATKGKSARAEPVAALYERRRVRHCGRFRALEDELCGLIAGGGYEGPGRSPDRADALVWAVSELVLGQRGTARVAVV
ncbi:DNA-packaging protein [Sphingomonas sp.]|uniref:DNA-packaging protein n=1 Tax=Sphingomonas sp. TaxID=28214 RepID=UPI0039C9A9A9